MSSNETRRKRLLLFIVVGGVMLVAPSLTIASEAKTYPSAQSLQTASSQSYVPGDTIYRIGSPARRKQSLVADLTPDSFGTSSGNYLELYLCGRSCSDTHASSARPPAKELQSFLAIRRE